MSSALSKDKVIEAAGTVVDPLLERDLASLGFPIDAEIDGGAVRLRVDHGLPRFDKREELRETLVEKIRAAGAESVEVDLRTDVLGHRPPDRENLLRGVRNVIAVASGKGGVGKSTLATNLALSLAGTDARVGMLDADVYGPSLGIMLGVRDQPEITSNNTIVPLQALGMSVISIAFLTPDSPDTPVIWRGPMVHGLINQFLTQVEWGELDYLVIDLPPGTGDAQLTLTQTAPLAGAVIVSTPQDVALIDARKGLKMFEQVNVPVLGLVENMSYFECPKCNERTEIFSHGGGERTSRDLKIPFLGEVPIDPEVVVGGDQGAPIVARNPRSPAARAYKDIAERVAVSLCRLAIQSGDDSPSFHIKW